jgi:excisionase family DNA binding protein
MTEELLDADALAARLGCSRDHARKLMSNGQVPTFRLGRLIRVHPGALDRWILDHTEYPAAHVEAAEGHGLDLAVGGRQVLARPARARGRRRAPGSPKVPGQDPEAGGRQAEGRAPVVLRRTPAPE